jgi:hypothetical protein
MKTALNILIALIVIALIGCAARFDFYIWRLQHPQAPAWTWIFK